MNKGIIRKISIYCLSLIIFFALWCLLSKLISSSLILPGPLQVLSSFFSLCIKKPFWINFINTLLRVFISFLITVIFGALIGLLTGTNSFFNDLLKFPLSVIRVTPVLSIILIALFWFKSNTVPVFVCILMTLPVMINSVTSGFFKCDKKLLKMAKVYKLSKKQIFRYIKLPNVIPYFLNGALSVFGLCWKVVIAGEVISLPSKAVGTYLQQEHIHLETSSVIAATLFIVTVSFLLELLFSYFVKKINGKYYAA